VDLHAAGGIAGVGGADLVEAQEGVWGVVELAVVDFVVGKGSVEGDFDVGDEGDVLHFGWLGLCGGGAVDGRICCWCWSHSMRLV